MKKKKTTYAKAIAEAMYEEMDRDENVIFLGEDVGVFGGALAKLPELYQTFGPERVIDTPLAEQMFTTYAVGMAMAGKRPIVEIMFADFASLAFDPIANVAAKERYMSGGNVSVPIVFRTGQGVGAQCGSVHSQSIEAWFLNIPGLKIAVPSTPCDVKGLLKSAIRDDDPVLFLESRTAYYQVKDEIPDGEYTIPFGKATVARQGSDVTIVAWHKSYHDSMAAARELFEEEGISVEIIDPRTLVPLDKETILNSVKKTGRFIVAHEAPKRGGAGGEIASMVAEEAFDFLKAPVKRVGGANIPIPFGIIELEVIPTKESVKKAVLELMNRSNKDKHLSSLP